MTEPELARFVYVAVRSDGAHKIGVSAHLDARRDQVADLCEQDVDYVCLWPVRPDEAFKIEGAAHVILDDRALGGEWFKASALDACAAILEARRQVAAKRRRPSMTWGEFYAVECARFGKEAVDANLLKMNADWDAYWRERGSEHCGLDL